MNVVAAAILVLSASGSASLKMESEHSIARILVGVGRGAAKDVLGSGVGDLRGEGLFGQAGRIKPQLWIDGRSRSGLGSWGASVVRVGGYVADLRSDGSVGLAYAVRVRRYQVFTTTVVADGVVQKTIDARWTEFVPITKRITRRIPIHVSITIRATERTGAVRQTRLVGVASGTADTSEFRCGLVRRIAEREAAATLRRELGQTLWTVRDQGVRWYESGTDDIRPALDRIGAGMRAIRILRR